MICSYFFSVLLTLDHERVDTRWACRYSAINAVCCTFDYVLLALEEIAASTHYNKAIEAKGLLHQVKSFSFIISLVMFNRVLSCTKQLSNKLQSSTMDLFRASELVSASKAMLLTFHTDDYWDSVYSYATDIAKLHSIEAKSNSRKRKRPAYLEDIVLSLLQ